MKGFSLSHLEDIVSTGTQDQTDPTGPQVVIRRMTGKKRFDSEDQGWTLGEPPRFTSVSYILGEVKGLRSIII